MTDQRILELADEILASACEENRHRDSEIMQGVDGEKEHVRDVLRWVEKLQKNPSIALQIAALFHDVDRVVTPGVGGGFKGDRSSPEYDKHKKEHARRSADCICPILIRKGVPKEAIDRVRFLILHHDDKGSEVDVFKDEELQTLVAADSFAFFTSIAPKLYKAEGLERIKDKVRFMIEKIPRSSRKLLAKHQLDNPVFEKLKGDILTEFA